MKSSQVMERIESAGWKRIRSDGSHFVYEHPKYGRKMYAKGRPQSEVNKHRLRQIAEEFHLVEIETARIEARLAEAKRRPEPARVALARVIPEPDIPGSDYSDQEMRILFAQLHKEHGYSSGRIASETKINSGDLVDFLHHGKALGRHDRSRLVAYMAARRRELGLTLNRADLIKKGYGARTGVSNAVDPSLAVFQEAIRKTLDAGVLEVDLAQTIGVVPSVISGIKTGKSKTIYPSNKQKIQRWFDQNWAEPLPGLKSETEYHAEQAPETPTVPQEAEKSDVDRILPPTIDDELAAIQIVLKAVKPLNVMAAKRALRYVLERME